MHWRLFEKIGKALRGFVLGAFAMNVFLFFTSGDPLFILLLVVLFICLCASQLAIEFAKSHRQLHEELAKLRKGKHGSRKTEDQPGRKR